jgi:ferric-dicitrate binding protein FerR (iron transport regulator)
MSDERAERIAEETRLRERAQHWAAELTKAQDAGEDAEALQAHYKQAVKEHDAFLSGFDSGEAE